MDITFLTKNSISMQILLINLIIKLEKQQQKAQKILMFFVLNGLSMMEL